MQANNLGSDREPQPSTSRGTGAVSAHPVEAFEEMGELY
jgi:hypothetical protein